MNVLTELESLEVLTAPPKASLPSTLKRGPPKNPIGASSANHSSSPIQMEVGMLLISMKMISFLQTIRDLLKIALKK